MKLLKTYEFFRTRLSMPARAPAKRSGRTAFHGSIALSRCLLTMVFICCCIGLQYKTVAANTGGAISNALQKAQPRWTMLSRRLITFNNRLGSGLNKIPFPDVSNPMHVEIWNLLDKEHKIGNGFGTICDYFGVYLINIITGDSVESYFYNPTNRIIYDANEGSASAFYAGDRSASVTNAVALVRAILGVTGEEAIVVTSAENIPHTRWQKNHPKASFGSYLLGKGIAIHNPEMFIARDGPVDGWWESTECSVLTYFSHGGQVIRYQVQCREGQIIGVDRFVMGTGIGDCWVDM